MLGTVVGTLGVTVVPLYGVGLRGRFLVVGGEGAGTQTVASGRSVRGVLEQHQHYGCLVLAPPPGAPEHRLPVVS